MKKKIPLIILAFVLCIIIILSSAILFLKWEAPVDFFRDLVGTKKVTPEELLQQARTWVYDINLYDEGDVKMLAESNYDVVIVDTGDIDEDGVKQIKADGNKLVFSYLSIGQAETYRDYWKEDWDANSPDWLDFPDPNWEGCFNIKFWDEEWKRILFGSEGSSLDKIISEGFDGVYLDTAGTDYWSSLDDVDAEEEMLKLIEEISSYAKSRDKHFLIIPQNLGFMEGDYSERLKNKIDAVGQEEVFYGFENKDGKETPVSVSRSVVNKLDKYKENGLPVFVIDYPFICSTESEEQIGANSCYDKENLLRMRDSYSKGWDKGYIMYSQNREASGVTYFIPQIANTSVEYENLPILSWEVFSGNSAIGQDAYRMFISSTHSNLENDDPDIYDSGKVWTKNKAIGFIPDKEIEDEKYFWKVVVYEQIDDVSLVSNWSEIVEFEYKNSETEFDELNSYNNEGYQTAWIPNWGFEKGFESLKKSKEFFESISPVWFELLEDGTLKHESYYNNEDFMKFCRENDINIIPSIPQFDSDILSKVLNEHLDEHVDAIYNEVKDGDYDGIDLDYESTYLKDKELYFELLQKLSDKLAADKRVLSVTVLSKWADNQIYSFLPETRQVQDWALISKYADEVRIMAYDYTSQTSYVPGPMSPIYWEDLILRYAARKIPKEKIVLALPLYGYSFRIDEKSEISTDIFEGGEKAGSEKRVLAYTYEDIVEVGQEFEFIESFDQYSQEKVTKYNDERYDRALYFEDEKAIKIRRSLAEKYGIKGVAYWRLGDENPKCFE